MILYTFLCDTAAAWWLCWPPVYFCQHWFNKLVSGHVFFVVYTDETYNLLFIARNSLDGGSWVVSRKMKIILVPLSHPCCVEFLMLPFFFNEMYRAAYDRHLQSITTLRIYIAELKTSGHDDVSKPRSLLFWTWPRHPLGPVGHFVFNLLCPGALQSLAEARIKVWSNKVGKILLSAPEQESLPPTNDSFNENIAYNKHL